MGEKSRRERAAQARGEAQASEKRRERIVRIVGGATVVAVMAAIIGVAVYASSNSPSTDAGGLTGGIVEPDPSAALPVGVLAADSSTPFGVPYGTGSADVPVLELWEDFQCPACGALEIANGAGIAKLAEEGSVQLVYRPTAFLDGNLGNDSSHRAIAAWGCAIDAGKVKEYHDIVYANQPIEEGMGFTEEQLLGFGTESGLTEAEFATFTQCVIDGTYLAWAANTNQEFLAGQIGGTPAGFLNGEPVETAILADPVALAELVVSKS
jgi:protein-disulfide isomerase